ncbi:MAG TPA: bifunctional homocysteine S-methyltransferase/methylenetetrahydrofolate reductase [Bryobacteraceae bacterium]
MGLPTPQTRTAEFRESLAQRILVADGAMGTMLLAKGVSSARCLEELNLSLAALVRDVHREYARAGADILETNTFGANRKRLAVFGLGGIGSGIEAKVRQINRAGVRIAREAARAARGDSAYEPFVAGVVGPLGVRLAPLGSTGAEEARAIFREQIEALVAAGVDLLMLETFRDLTELGEAILAAREAAGPDLAIAAHLSIEDDGSLADGSPPQEFTRRLDSWPVDIVGLNCSSGPRAILETVEKMAAWTGKPLSVLPSAGLPVAVDSRNVYLCSPAYMANYARRFFRVGVRIVGGCCGTTPEHIREIRGQALVFQPGEIHRTVEVEENASPPSLEAVPFAEKSQFASKLASGRFVATVEILPPRGADFSREIEGARLAQRAGIDCASVPDSPLGTARLSAAVLCQLIQREAGLETLLHFCCRDRNVLSLQSDLLGANALGIRNLLCITGDPIRRGAYPDATGVFDVDSIGLTAMVRNLNQGLDLGGNPMGSQTAFAIGAGANPGAIDLDREHRRLEAKIGAGAEFVVTQPIFDLDLLELFLKRVEQYRIPVIAGIWPLTSFRNAEFMIHELRVPVPPSFMARMSVARNGEAGRAEGISIARELIQRVRTMVAGVQLSSPFGHYQMALEVAQAL